MKFKDLTPSLYWMKEGSSWILVVYLAYSPGEVWSMAWDCPIAKITTPGSGNIELVPLELLTPDGKPYWNFN